MQVKDTKANRKKCICPTCPSYPKDCKGEVLYCSLGKSKCGINANGCNCPYCLVYSENKLSSIYFCDKDQVGNVLMRKKKDGEDDSFYQTVADIKSIANSGESIVRSMGSQKKMPFSFDDLHFVPAQVERIPLNKEEAVKIDVMIGPMSKRPLKLSSPIIISGMSFGAVSRNVRLVISKASPKMKIGFNSGEGGVLPEEMEGSKYMIIQYATGRFGINEAVLKKAAAIEIRFGQGAYPGKGSFLPAVKITPEIARIRGLRPGEDAYSPAHHSDMTTPKEIEEKVNYLRKLTDGIPIGAKIGCGNIEKDIKVLANAEVDFIALDGFGGGTGATDYYARENLGIPILAALPRACKALNELEVRDRISLIAGGGLRKSSDFAKCLALGADAVYIGTAALIAINCEQYRICHTGLCPTGVTTHRPDLTKQLDVQRGIAKLTNFIGVSNHEIANFARMVGKDDVKKLDMDDLVSLDRDLSAVTGVSWLNGC